MRKPAAARAPTTVGPVPAERRVRGDAGGLVDDDEVVVVVDDAEVGHGDRLDLERCVAPPSSTSSQPPARSRSDLPTDAPSSVTPPASAISAAQRAREPEQLREPGVDARRRRARRGRGTSGAPFRPRARAGRRPRAWARRRSPSRPRLVVADGSAPPFAGFTSREPSRPMPADREDHEQHHARDDRDVGDVVDRRDQPRCRDEVDDVAEAEARLAKEPVGEVAEHAAEQQPEDDRPGDRADAPCEPDDEGDHAGGEDREDPGHAARERECRAGVPHELPLEQGAQHRHDLTLGEVRDDEELAQLVEAVRRECGAGHDQEGGGGADLRGPLSRQSPGRSAQAALRAGPRRRPAPRSPGCRRPAPEPRCRARAADPRCSS